MLAAFGIVIGSGVCVYPDILIQSFLYPEAIDAEGVLAPLDLDASSFLSLFTHSIFDSSCNCPSSKNSLFGHQRLSGSLQKSWGKNKVPIIYDTIPAGLIIWVEMDGEDRHEGR